MRRLLHDSITSTTMSEFTRVEEETQAGSLSSYPIAAKCRILSAALLYLPSAHVGAHAWIHAIVSGILTSPAVELHRMLLHIFIDESAYFERSIVLLSAEQPRESTPRIDAEYAIGSIKLLSTSKRSIFFNMLLTDVIKQRTMAALSSASSSGIAPDADADSARWQGELEARRQQLYRSVLDFGDEVVLQWMQKAVEAADSRFHRVQPAADYCNDEAHEPMCLQYANSLMASKDSDSHASSPASSTSGGIPEVRLSVITRSRLQQRGNRGGPINAAPCSSLLSSDAAQRHASENAFLASSAPELLVLELLESIAEQERREYCSTGSKVILDVLLERSSPVSPAWRIILAHLLTTSIDMAGNQRRGVTASCVLDAWLRAAGVSAEFSGAPSAPTTEERSTSASPLVEVSLVPIVAAMIELVDKALNCETATIDHLRTLRAYPSHQLRFERITPAAAMRSMRLECLAPFLAHPAILEQCSEMLLSKVIAASIGRIDKSELASVLVACHRAHGARPLASLLAGLTKEEGRALSSALLHDDGAALFVYAIVNDSASSVFDAIQCVTFDQRLLGWCISSAASGPAHVRLQYATLLPTLIDRIQWQAIEALPEMSAQIQRLIASMVMYAATSLETRDAVTALLRRILGHLHRCDTPRTRRVIFDFMCAPLKPLDSASLTPLSDTLYEEVATDASLHDASFALLLVGILSSDAHTRMHAATALSQHEAALKIYIERWQSLAVECIAQGRWAADVLEDDAPARLDQLVGALTQPPPLIPPLKSRSQLTGGHVFKNGRSSAPLARSERIAERYTVASLASSPFFFLGVLIQAHSKSAIDESVQILCDGILRLMLLGGASSPVIAYLLALIAPIAPPPPWLSIIDTSAVRAVADIARESGLCHLLGQGQLHTMMCIIDDDARRRILSPAARRSLREFIRVDLCSRPIAFLAQLSEGADPTILASMLVRVITESATPMVTRAEMTELARVWTSAHDSTGDTGAPLFHTALLKKLATLPSSSTASASSAGVNRAREARTLRRIEDTATRHDDSASAEMKVKKVSSDTAGKGTPISPMSQALLAMQCLCEPDADLSATAAATSLDAAWPLIPPVSQAIIWEAMQSSEANLLHRVLPALYTLPHTSEVRSSAILYRELLRSLHQHASEASSSDALSFLRDVDSDAFTRAIVAEPSVGVNAMPSTGSLTGMHLSLLALGPVSADMDLREFAISARSTFIAAARTLPLLATYALYIWQRCTARGVNGAAASSAASWLLRSRLRAQRSTDALSSVLCQLLCRMKTSAQVCRSYYSCRVG
jgi:hypothetical protein